MEDNLFGIYPNYCFVGFLFPISIDSILFIVCRVMHSRLLIRAGAIMLLSAFFLGTAEEKGRQ